MRLEIRIIMLLGLSTRLHGHPGGASVGRTAIEPPLLSSMTAERGRRSLHSGVCSLEDAMPTSLRDDALARPEGGFAAHRVSPAVFVDAQVHRAHMVRESVERHCDASVDLGLHLTELNGGASTPDRGLHGSSPFREIGVEFDCDHLNARPRLPIPARAAEKNPADIPS
jgi:hypothetical protein